jgi:hypothetical protein
VRHVQRDAGADQPVHQPSFRRGRRHAVHRPQEQRMVRDQQVRSPLDRFIGDRHHRIDREKHTPNLGLRVAANQPDGIPRLSPRRVV